MASLWSDKVLAAIQSARIVSHFYQPSQSRIRILENGSVYINADMDTDTDGSPRSTVINPQFGQLSTSLSRRNGWRGDAEYVNSETIPYFVLPGNFASTSGITCKLGDLALVRWQGHEVFAVYADNGPNSKIGEGSIKLVESLGDNPWNNTKTKIISGIGFGVEYLVFPKSTSSRPIPSTYEEIQKVGLEVFQEKFGGIMSFPYKVVVKDPQPPLNVRSKAGTSNSLVGTIPNDTILTVVGKGEVDGAVWLQINSPISGWVAKYLTSPQAEEGEVIQRDKVGSVAAWQHLLNGCGYSPLKLNGWMDAATLKATKKLQQEAEIPETGVIDDVTWQAAFDRKKSGWELKVPPLETNYNEPTWMSIAKGEIGEQEISGRSYHNSRIVEYHKTTTLSASDDETAWCSSFACWCMQKAGLDNPRSAWAYDWRTWSGIRKLDQPQYGCIVVLGKSPGGSDGHVGFFISKNGY